MTAQMPNQTATQDERRQTFVVEEVDVVVVGAGHAGCEAAIAAAKLGFETVLFTLHLDCMADLPCNPNIGGTAKGQLVREIDALGGVMGLLADEEMIQFRMLNASKGPAVLSPRAQIDRTAYQRRMKATVEKQARLQLVQQEVVRLHWTDVPGENIEREHPHKIITGVETRTGAIWLCRKVILTTGTFLNSRVCIGESVYDSGPDGLASAAALTASLQEIGLPLKRFKTGTPVRLMKSSIDLSQYERQPGDDVARPFSYENDDNPDWQPKAELPCWITRTTDETRQIVLDNLDRSPLYSGVIKGIGPRYCPSIEDKYVKFPEHKRHHLFIEPTGLDTEEMYLAGLSSSMPEDIQREMLRSIPGLEKSRIMRVGYAIEYDLVDPTHLDLSLETRSVSGLYCAGQINGSSGYEEAAGQGLIAGINAARSLKGLEPIILSRSQGYLGVLIDDLVTKGTDEPYRLMTARAEYRLILRQDNADERLLPIGHEIGLISDERFERFQIKQANIVREKERLRMVSVRPEEANPLLEACGSTPLRQAVRLIELLRRPELGYDMLAPLDPERPSLTRAERERVKSA